MGGGSRGEGAENNISVASKAFHYVNGVRARASAGCPLVNGLSQFAMLTEAESSIYVKIFTPRSTEYPRRYERTERCGGQDSCPTSLSPTWGHFVENTVYHRQWPH